MKKFFRWLGRLSPPKPKYYTAKCGHETELEGTVTVHGPKGIKSSTFTLYEENLSHCFDCLTKMATACHGCGKPILIGESVQRSLETIEHSAPEFVIGTCCTELGIADVTGRWTENGYKDVPFQELVEIR